MFTLNTTGCSTAAKNFFRLPFSRFDLMLPEHGYREERDINHLLNIYRVTSQQITIRPVQRIIVILVFPYFHRNTIKALFVNIVYSTDQ